MAVKKVSIVLVLTLVLTMFIGAFGVHATDTQRVVAIYNDGSDIVVDGTSTNNEWNNSVIDTTASFKSNFDVKSTYNGVDGFNFLTLGTPTAAESFTNSDFSSTVYFKVDNDYIYFYEERVNSNMYYASDDAKECYKNNGGIIFFIKKDGTKFSQVSDIMYQPRGKTNTEATLARRTYPSGAADDNIEYTAKSVVSATSYTIEAKVKLSSINITLSDLQSGNIYMTYVAANSFADVSSGSLTKDNFCQFNYFGVGVWDKSPLAVFTDAEVKNVESLISAIGTVTLESKDAISAAHTAYEALTEVQKGKVGNYQTLTDAQTAYKALIIYGDINDDTEITAADALLALQYSVEKITFTDKQLLFADVDTNPGITANDALLILQYSVEKITSFPIQNVELF